MLSGKQGVNPAAVAVSWNYVAYLFYLNVVLLVGISPIERLYLVLIGTYPISLSMNDMYSNVIFLPRWW